MDNEVERELSALRQSVDELSERLGKLELLVLAPNGQAVPVPLQIGETSASEAPVLTEPLPTSDVAGPQQELTEPVSAPGVLPPVQPQPPSTVDAPSPDQQIAPIPSAVPAAADAKAADHSLEARIGLFWLNRIGVASLVVGVALLILYSFQYFGSLAKLATGLSISAALVALGEWLGYRRRLSWYGQGLIGGGWSLAYFTVYAMHFVESVRVIESPLTDSMLLLLVALGATVHAVYRRAEIIAVLAVVLGFVTVPLGQLESMSPIALTVLALSAAILAARMQWQRLYLWGIVAVYICGMAADPGFAANLPAHEWLARRLAYFGVLWAAFMAALIFFTGDEQGGKKRLILGTCVNAVGFFSAMHSPVEAVLHGNSYWFALVLAGIYAVSFAELRRRGINAIASSHLVIALTFASAAIPMALVSEWYVSLWAIEVAALSYLGLRYGIRVMRWFALGLSFVAGTGILIKLFDSDATVTLMGLLVPTKCLLTVFGAVGLGLAANFHKSARFSGQQGKRERRWFYYLYFLGASTFAWLTPPLAFYHGIDGESWLPTSTANGLLPVWWTLEAAAAIVFGVLSPSRFARIVGMVGLVVAGWALIILFGDWTWPGSLAIVSCLYGMGYVYQRSSTVLGRESVVGNSFSVAGSFITTVCIGSKAAAAWISPAWTLLGLLLLFAGFRLPDRWFRVSGLLVFALVMFKLLFVDLSGAATIQRILSFIGAGVVLLVASYAYGRYAALLGPGDKDSSGQG